MILGHKIELKTNSGHRRDFFKACGTARYAYNWGLEHWNKIYKETGKAPKARELKKQWNKEKPKWVYESPKGANQQPFTNLNKAFQKFFKNKAKYPQFKKKGVRDSFYIENDKFHVSGRYVRLPKIGPVKMTEQLRFVGKIMGAVVSREADRWFISFQVDVTSKIKKEKEQPLKRSSGKEIFGVDLGLNNFVTLSTGERVEAPKPLQRVLDKLKSRQRKHSKKQKGSNNRRKSAMGLARLHRRVKNQRRDFLHKLTSSLCMRAKCIMIEDLNVRGMMVNHKLSQAISDVGWGEFRRQIEYKSLLYGIELTVVSRFFPSTKTCNSCGLINDIPLSQRTYTCECGYSEDRDVNAALNLRNYTLGYGEINACGHEGSGFGETRSETVVSESGISVCVHQSSHRK